MKDGKLHRVTFAYSVAKRISELAGEGFEVIPVKLMRGKPIPINECRSPGLFGIVSKAKDKLLRVAMTPEIAKILADDNSRYLCEIFILP